MGKLHSVADSNWSRIKAPLVDIMLNIPIEDALAELAYSIAVRLADGSTVEVAGFGEFGVRHVPTHVENRSASGTVLQPARNIVIFHPNEREG